MPAGVAMADTHTGPPATGPPPDDEWHASPGDDTWTASPGDHRGRGPDPPADTAPTWPPPQAGTMVGSPAAPADEGTALDGTGVDAHDGGSAEGGDTVGDGERSGGEAVPGPYDEGFFAAIDPESYASARVVVARVLGLTGARSVVDVGCGSGAWIRACRDLGVPEVVGVDGAYVPAEHRRRATEFIERDLDLPLGIDRRFSLAICLEVGEHLPPERAPGFVADLTTLAPVVLFSAAVPGQGGTHHVNEQWSEYWVALFEAQGWTCRDAIRPWVRTNEDVAWWYRQNLYLAVAPTADAPYSSFPRLAAVRIPNPVDYVRRPRGDVMEPPLGPAPEPALATDEPPPPAAAVDGPDPAPPPDAEAPSAGHDDGAGDDLLDDRDDTEVDIEDERSPGRWRVDPGADELEHPRPPGWDALRRIVRRARGLDDD